MSNDNVTSLEVWADSFHEGDWACEQLGALVREQGGTHDVVYADGFQPVHTFGFDSSIVVLTVYGSYRAWDPVPEPVNELLAWGKPDFILYDPISTALLCAVEETAATPTGNQALQRCERQYGAARQSIPFWYLLSEYGMHVDGNIRRDSVWPTIMALKLSQDRGIPSVILHYSDLENPEDYSAGTGLRSLFETILQMVRNFALASPLLDGLARPLEEQFRAMLAFVSSQWRQQMDFLPGEDALTDELAGDYAAAATGDPAAGEIVWSKTFLRWPLIAELPAEVRASHVARPLLKYDPLCERAEQDIADGRSYGLSGSNTGSRPQPRASVEEWIARQRALFLRAVDLDPPAEFDLHRQTFPVSDNGLLHVTTARRITYLYDRWKDLSETIEAAYPRLSGRLPAFGSDEPALLYISNSIKPGRIFGDPFTGQIAAFAVAFGKLDPIPRRVIGYFPHQVHTQALVEGRKGGSKGVTIMRELTDLLVFHGGVAVRLGEGDVL